MNWFRGVSVCAIGLVWLAVGAGCAYGANSGKSEPVVIPLDQIWALNMPGTRDVKTLDESLVEEAQLAIGPSMMDGLQETKAAFAVLGTGEDALRAAHSVFTGKDFAEKNRRRITFPEESNVSVVFFSAKSTADVHLDRVEYQDKVINIYYRFVSDESAKTTRPIQIVPSSPQFAFIPLGKLSSGKYRVNVIESPLVGKKFERIFFPGSHTDTLHIVGNSFSFFVGEQPEADQEPNEVGGEIYLDEIWTNSMPGTRSLGKLNGGLVWEIQRSLWNASMKEKKEIKAGFAVHGMGLDVLRQAHAVLADGEMLRKEFPAGDNISVVFFSHASGYCRIFIPRVVRHRNVITIRYRFVPFQECLMVEAHVAVIPLGKLPSGKYRVNIVHVPMEPRKLGYPEVSEVGARRTVCNSFSFSVLEKRK